MLKSYHKYARAKISAVETLGARHGNLTFRLPQIFTENKTFKFYYLVVRNYA